MKESIISKANFAKKYQISRQLISKPEVIAQLDIVIENGKAMINLDGKKTQTYIRQLELSTNKGIDKKSLTTLMQKKQDDVDLLDDIDLVEKYKREQLRHKTAVANQTELKNAYVRGELMSRELVYDIMYFIDKIFSNVKRNGRAFLSDNSNKIAKKIIDGEPITDILNEWDNLQMCALADAKEDFIKKIKDIEKQQASEA